MTLEHDKACDLAHAVLLCAVRDARGRRFGSPSGSTAWLASRQASVWYDILDINQAAFLEAIGWADLARRALQDADLAGPERTCIEDSLQALGTA